MYTADTQYVNIDNGLCHRRLRRTFDFQLACINSDLDSTHTILAR